MENYADDFGPFSSIWINTSHQGAMPKTAVAALCEAIQWKVSPDHLADSRIFSSVPGRLRETLGRLINAPSKDIILANSASYGLHLLANGIKWLCGPYGTGFCWIEPRFREELDYNQAYWLAMQTADDLKAAKAWPEIRSGLGARKYDIFGTANFFNFVPWTASVTYLLDKGIEKIKSHNDDLIDQIRRGILLDKYTILTPISDSGNSTILVLSHKDKSRNEAIFELLKTNNIFISLRRQQLRLAPHLYNTPEEIDKVLFVLNRA